MDLAAVVVTEKLGSGCSGMGPDWMAMNDSDCSGLALRVAALAALDWDGTGLGWY